MTKRPIIEIDEDLCNGCGQCILTCQEGALKLVDGKARLVGEVYCDGLGACLGECPTGALTIVEREADDFDEEAVEELLAKKSVDSAGSADCAGEDTRAPNTRAPNTRAPNTRAPNTRAPNTRAPNTRAHGSAHHHEETLACGCPGSQVRTLEPRESACSCADDEVEARSELRQWPVKLQLLGPEAPFLKGADLLLLADCVAVAHPDLHRKFLRNYAIAIGCPKLDDLEAHIQRLTEILKGAHPRSLTVAHMEVPCCRGFVYAAEKAIKDSGLAIPVKRIQIGSHGEVQEEEELTVSGAKTSAAGK